MGERKVSVMLLDEGDGCRLTFEGQMTFEFSRDLEDQIIDALRRFTRFKLDLSRVDEIDLCGLHLLQIIHSFCGDRVEVIAGSPLVERASRQLLAPKRAISLRGTPHESTRRGREKYGEPESYRQMSH